MFAVEYGVCHLSEREIHIPGNDVDSYSYGK